MQTNTKQHPLKADVQVCVFVINRNRLHLATSQYCSFILDFPEASVCGSSTIKKWNEEHFVNKNKILIFKSLKYFLVYSSKEALEFLKKLL